MNIGEYSVNNRVISWLLVVIMIGGGLIAFERMGKLEDPAFTIKSAKILTLYPGATAREVQEELTHHLEDAIQSGWKAFAIVAWVSSILSSLARMSFWFCSILSSCLVSTQPANRTGSIISKATAIRLSLLIIVSSFSM